MTVPVTFSPTVPGQADGTLTVKTADGETDLLGVHGVGTKEGLGATPALVQFTDVPTKTVSRQTVNIVNTGTTVAKITGVTLPANAQLQRRPRHGAGRGADDPAPRIDCGVHDVQSHFGESGDRFARRRQRPREGDRQGDRDRRLRRGAPANAALAGLR